MGFDEIDLSPIVSPTESITSNKLTFHGVARGTKASSGSVGGGARRSDTNQSRTGTGSTAMILSYGPGPDYINKRSRKGIYMGAVMVEVGDEEALADGRVSGSLRLCYADPQATGKVYSRRLTVNSTKPP